MGIGIANTQINMKVKIVNESKFALPKYETSKSAGMDLHADIAEDVILDPHDWVLISSGIRIGLPDGYEAQIRPRSGLAMKYGITVLNAPGTIDGDYTGIIGVILINHSHVPFVIHPNDRIAQLVIAKYEQAEWDEVEILDETERGNGGFGHTGV